MREPSERLLAVAAMRVRARNLPRSRRWLADTELQRALERRDRLAVAVRVEQRLRELPPERRRESFRVGRGLIRLRCFVPSLRCIRALCAPHQGFGWPGGTVNGRRSRVTLRRGR